MLCIKCGKNIPNKAIEGADYILDRKHNWYCIDCARLCLDRWEDFERIQKLAEEPEIYRNALVDTLNWSIGEGYCMRPRERCTAEAEKCLKCWMEYLVGEREG